MANEVDWKGDASDIDDDDEYEMRNRAFAVTPFDINCVDETAIPLTSQEYLQQVIAQRSKLPEIVSATVPELSTKSCQNSIASLFLDEKIISSPHRPSDEWQQQQISNFSNLRYRIEVNRDSYVENSLKTLPRKENDWFQFLFHQNNAIKDITKCQPYLSTVLSMGNEIIETLIKHIINFVMEDKITIYQSGVWIFALLACIEVPILFPLIKKLRAFVRKCREIREKMDFSIEENKKELVAQNLFICLICKYFGQHDLSD